ncbi:MAG: hypothetical protein M1827_003127 [Pycnora praestabilis]|nr:MAG: hypothetical protein M1827_003127 [Pycnora praestabilis]
MMLRTGATRSLIRSLTTSTRSTTRATYNAACFKAQLTSTVRSLSSRRSPSFALSPHKPITTALQRYATTGPGTPYDHIDAKREDRIGHKTINPDPDSVSVDSSTISVFEGKEGEEQKESPMLAGVYQDLRTIKETFALTEVPREAYYLGLAGVLPYLATSLSTVYLAWDINHAAATGSGFLLSGQTAEALLHIVEPLQIGYGAVILSFLGAIHWGLEWAGYGGYHGYRRYAIGVAAPAVAWPTTLLPVEYALIAQFLAFNFLYFADARATVRGLAPPWYTTYRFILTFIVGASIVVSLIGRGQIADKVSRLPGPADRLKALRDSQMEGLEQEERERRAKRIAKDAEGDDDDDE